MGLLLRNGTLIDGTERAPVANATVTVEGNVIRTVSGCSGADRTAAPDATVLDCTGKYILPGLIDSHVHLTFSAKPDHLSNVARVLKDSDQLLALRALRNAQESLRAGVTTVRDCGDRHNVTLSLRDAFESGMVVGPRIIACGMPVTSTFGHLHFCGLEAEGVESLRVAVRQQAKCGVDWLKVMVTGGIMSGNAKPLLCQYSQSELDALCEEGRRLDKRVAVHVLSVEGIRRSVTAGASTLEHCAWSNPDGSSGHDPRLVDEIVAKGIAVGQTATGTFRNYLIEGFAPSETERQKALQDLHRRWQTTRDMRAAGVTMMLSTDSGVRLTPFSDVYLTLQFASMMMEASSLDTLRAMTQIPAEVLGLDHLGTVEAGKTADLLVLDADPLEDLGNVRSVNMVIKGGRIVVRDGHIAPPC